ncbi:MAG: hypothetical protein ACK5LM_03560, partial [Lactovum sp.]
MFFVYLSLAIATFGEIFLIESYRRFNYSSELYHFLDDSTLFIVAIVSFFVLLILYRLMPNVQIKK